MRCERKSMLADKIENHNIQSYIKLPNPLFEKKHEHFSRNTLMFKADV